MKTYLPIRAIVVLLVDVGLSGQCMRTYLPIRAIVVSVVAYILSFVIGSVGGAMLGATTDDPADIPPEVWYFGAFAAVAVMAGGSWFYFSSRHIRATALGGLAFGATSIGVGFVMDGVMVVAVMLANNEPEPIAAAMLDYYIQPIFWLTLVLILVVCVVMGMLMGRGKVAV